MLIISCDDDNGNDDNDNGNDDNNDNNDNNNNDNDNDDDENHLTQYWQTIMVMTDCYSWYINQLKVHIHL